MNTSLKHWKEAATLILAAGHRLGSRTAVRVGSHQPNSCSFDYDVLLLKRSSRSGFMPNAYVFPGGMLDSSDFSSDWLDVFKHFTDIPRFGLRSVEQPLETRPPIFATDRLKLGSPVPGEVALRICALRETFEESGVLLVVSKKEKQRLLKSFQVSTANLDAGVTSGHLHTEHDLCASELTRWRTLVNQNPSNFISMCRELEVLPNIWALHEWANWLTPTGRYGTTRFDTAFFVCCLQEIPRTRQDEKEIECFQWSSPSQVLHSYQAQQLWIAPPQFYELSRLCRLPSLNDLHSFAHQRATEGCEQWMPVVVPNDEHYISLLPGDKLYPPDSSEASQTGTHGQIEDLQEPSGLHRMVLLDLYTATLQVTIKPKYKHLLPVVELENSTSHL